MDELREADACALPVFQGAGLGVGAATGGHMGAACAGVRRGGGALSFCDVSKESSCVTRFVYTCRASPYSRMASVEREADSG